MMNEKRFVLCKKGDVEYIEDNGCVQLYGFDVICEMLNEQQATILTLKRRLERITRGYEHLPHKNGLTPNEWVIESQEKELKKKNEQISEWIEQQSKDIAKISEQQEEISYWKHRVSSLLFILSQFDNEKVRKLLEELE